MYGVFSSFKSFYTQEHMQPLKDVSNQVLCCHQIKYRHWPVAHTASSFFFLPPSSFLPLSPPISTQVLLRFELLGSCGSFGLLSRNRSLWVALKTLLLTRPLLPGWPTGKEVATNSCCHRQSLQLLCPFCLMDCISISCIWVSLSPYDATKATTNAFLQESLNGLHKFKKLEARTNWMNLTVMVPPSSSLPLFFSLPFPSSLAFFLLSLFFYFETR